MPELEDTGNRSSRRFSRTLVVLVVVVLTLATIIAGAIIGRRSYLIVSMLIAVYSMLPFFIQFERRIPKARELVALSVMIALAVAARAAFALVPGFKPMLAVIMITGMAFGSSSGFLCGSLSMLISNFIFGQGPWTPFQMLSGGLSGYAFGFLAERGVIPYGNWSMVTRVLASFGGLAFCVLIAGPVLDTSSVFWLLGAITPESVAAIYLAGLPFNLMQGIATFVTIFALGNAVLRKLARIKTKYGLLG